MNTRKTPNKKEPNTAEDGAPMTSSPIHGTRSRTGATPRPTLQSRVAPVRTPGKKGSTTEEKKQDRERRKLEEEALKSSTKKAKPKPRVAGQGSDRESDRESDTENRVKEKAEFAFESSEEEGDEKDPEELLQNGRENKGHLAEGEVKADTGSTENKQENGKAEHGSENGVEAHTNGVVKPTEPASSGEETGPSQAPKDNHADQAEEKEDEVSKQNGSEDEVRLLKASKRRETEGESSNKEEGEGKDIASAGRADSSLVVVPASNKPPETTTSTSSLPADSSMQHPAFKDPYLYEDGEEEAQIRKARVSAILEANDRRWDEEIARRRRVLNSVRRREEKMHTRLNRELARAWDEEYRIRGFGSPAPLPIIDNPNNPFMDYLVKVEEESEDEEEAVAEERIGANTVVADLESELTRVKSLLHERDDRIDGLLDEKLALYPVEPDQGPLSTVGSSGGVNFWEDLKKERVERQQLERELEEARKKEQQWVQELDEKVNKGVKEELRLLKLKRVREKNQQHSSESSNKPSSSESPNKKRRVSKPIQDDGQLVVSNNGDHDDNGDNENNTGEVGTGVWSRITSKFTKRNIVTSVVIGTGVTAAALAQGAIEVSNFNLGHPQSGMGFM